MLEVLDQITLRVIMVANRFQVGARQVPGKRTKVENYQLPYWCRHHTPATLACSRFFVATRGQDNSVNYSANQKETKRHCVQRACASICPPAATASSSALTSSALSTCRVTFFVLLSLLRPSAAAVNMRHHLPNHACARPGCLEMAQRSSSSGDFAELNNTLHQEVNSQLTAVSFDDPVGHRRHMNIIARHLQGNGAHCALPLSYVPLDVRKGVTTRAGIQRSLRDGTCI